MVKDGAGRRMRRRKEGKVKDEGKSEKRVSWFADPLGSLSSYCPAPPVCWPRRVVWVRGGSV